MQKSSKKPGLSLIEVVCALGILCLMSSYILNVQLSNLKLERLSRERFMYVSVLEGLREEIISNCTYDEIVSLINENKIFINKDSLKLETVKTHSLSQLFSGSLISTEHYLRLSVVPGQVLKVQLDLHLKVGTLEEVTSCVFYKGNYL